MTDTTRDELLAAADRRRNDSYDDYDQEQMDADCIVLADAYLASQSASEPVNAKLLAACEKISERLVDYGLSKFPSEWYATLKSAIDAARAQAEDDAMPVDEAWLLSHGFIRAKCDGVLWPSIRIPSGQVMQWRAAGMWIGDTPIVLTTTRGDVRRLLAALGVEAK